MDFFINADDTFASFKAASPQPGTATGDNEETPFMVLESAPVFESVSDFADKTARSQAMGAVLTWLNDGEYTHEALDGLIYGLADVDDDGEVTKDEQAIYDALRGAAGDALVSLGASGGDVKTFMDESDDEAGVKIGNRLSDKMEGSEKSDSDIVNTFALESCPVDDSGEMILEATKKIVRDGRVVLVKKRLKKRRLSAKQRAALKKARRKANSAAARAKRKKAMRIRKQRGM